MYTPRRSPFLHSLWVLGVDAGSQAQLEKEFAEMGAQVGKVGGQVGAVQEGLDHDRLLWESQVPVSYTHLTLPTICSV